MSLSKEKMGFGTVCLLGINGIVGTGIFLLPGFGMKSFGPASILALMFDAVLILMISSCFAECGDLFSVNGGSYLYARSAFGDFVGYEVGISLWVTRVIAEATIYVALLTAIGGVFPSMNTPLNKNIFITIVGLALMALNVSGVRITSIFNNIITIAKLTPIILMILVGIFAIHGVNFHPFFVPKLATVSNFSQTTITLFYIFTGFGALGVVAGAMKNPKHDIPRAIIISILSVTVLYVAVMVVSIGVMGPKLAGSQVPLQLVFTHLAGNLGKYIIVAGSVLSMAGIVICSSFVTPRSMSALARTKIMPNFLTKRNRRGAPYVAIIVSTLIVMILAYSGTFVKLASINAVSRFAQFIPTCLAVIVFRRRLPHAKRTFKVPFGYVVPILAVIVSIWLLANNSKTNLIWGFGALILAMPFYFLTRTFKDSRAKKASK